MAKTSPEAMLSPIASRAHLADDYGLPPDSPLLPWPQVEERIAKALHYWLSTADASGTPIARPIDGMWVDSALYFGGDPGNRWRRNLAANPAACITLEDAECAVILEGVVNLRTPDAALAARLAADANAKYEWADQPAEAYAAESCVFTPRRALAWTLLYKDATRFRFPSS